MKKSKRKIVWRLIGIIGLLIVIGIIFDMNYKKQQAENNPDTKQAIVYNAKHHTVTKYLTNFSEKQGLNVKAYSGGTQNKLDFNTAIAKLKTGEYKRITLLMYFDGCPYCVKEKSKLATVIKHYAKTNSPVFIINNSRKAKEINKYFTLPSYYHYPSLFEYDLSTNQGLSDQDKLQLTKSALLRQNY